MKKIKKTHWLFLLICMTLSLFSSSVFAGNSYNAQNRVLYIPLVIVDGNNFEVKLAFDGVRKFTLLDSKPSTQTSTQPVIYDSTTGVATISHVVVSETGKTYSAILTLIANESVVSLELTSLNEFVEDSSIIIQEIYNQNLKTKDICRAGDQIKVTGLNLDKLDSPDLMLSSISIARIAKYISQEEGALYFECLETEHYGDIDIFLMSKTMSSRATVMTSLAISAPVLTDVNYSYTTNEITVTGINLDKSLTINLGDRSLTLDRQNEDPNTFSFIADSLMKSGDLKVIADNIHSNSIWVKVDRIINGKVELISNNVGFKDLVIGLDTDDNNPNIAGDFQIDGYRGKPTFIPIFIHAPNQTEGPEFILYLSAITLPEDDFIEVSPMTTAIALLWTGMNVEINVSSNDHAVFREQIAALPETTLFANLLAQTLSTNPYVMQEEFKSGALYDANFAALTATYQLIEQYQADRKKKTNHSFAKKSNTKKARVFPEVFDDITVYENIDDDGNITVENDTQLFLAVEIKDAEGNILQEYPRSSFSRNIVEAQNNWYVASKRNFRQPQGKHSTIKVLTPGFDNRSNPGSIIQEYNDIRTGLLLRTVIENILYPLFDILGIPSTQISKIIFNSTSPIFSAVTTVLAGENPNIRDVLYAISAQLAKDLLGPGPITKELIVRFGSSIIDTAAKKLGGYFIPGIGQIKMAYLIIDAVPAAVTMTDIASTDPLIDFNVQFTPTIEYVIPNQLQENELTNDISILGSSYGAVIDEANGKKVYPEIYFRDQEGVIKIVNVKEASFIQNDGNKVIVKLPAEFQKASTKFPLDIAIRHPTTKPNPDFPIVENAIDLVFGNQPPLEIPEQETSNSEEVKVIFQNVHDGRGQKLTIQPNIEYSANDDVDFNAVISMKLRRCDNPTPNYKHARNSEMCIYSINGDGNLSLSQNIVDYLGSPEYRLNTANNKEMLRYCSSTNNPRECRRTIDDPFADEKEQIVASAEIRDLRDNLSPIGFDNNKAIEIFPSVGCPSWDYTDYEALNGFAFMWTIDRTRTYVMEWDLTIHLYHPFDFYGISDEDHYWGIDSFAKTIQPLILTYECTYSTPPSFGKRNGELLYSSISINGQRINQ